MRGTLVRTDPRQIVRSTAAAAQKHNLALPQTTVQETSRGWRERSAHGRSVPADDQQQVLRKQYPRQSAHFSDNRRIESTLSHPDLDRKDYKVLLWLKCRNKLLRVNSQSARIDGPSKTTTETGLTVARRPGALAANEKQYEVAICKRLCEDGLVSDAVDVLDQLVQQRFHVSSNLFYRVLKRCIQTRDLGLGRRLHALIVQSGLERDAFLATHLIGLYASHGRLEEAMGVFTKVSSPDVYNWATIIFAYARHGETVEAAMAVRLYRQMCQSTTVKPDGRIYSAALKACAAAKDIAAGKEIHSHVLSSSGKPDSFVQAGLVNMYAKCGCIEDARNLFDSLRDRTVVIWNVMIAGYAQQGMGQESLCLYRMMQQEGLTPPNCVTYASLLQACASMGVEGLDEGKQLQVEITERGLEQYLVLGTSLVNMYAKCGSIEEARIVFDKLSERNLVAWNAMITGYGQQGMGHTALDLYKRMQNELAVPPDRVTYLSLLQACSSIGVGILDEGMQLHAQIKERGLEEDVALGTSLVNMYAKCGSLHDASKLFGKLPEKNIVAWNAMIAGYAQQGLGQESLRLYASMQQEGASPNVVTYVSLLQACASIGVGALNMGKQLHGEMREQGLQDCLALGTGLVNMYAKCGSLEHARRLFDTLTDKTVVTWTAMISGYAQQGMGQKALCLYKRMQREGLNSPNSVTYACLLQACASLGAQAHCEGKQLHAAIRKQGLQEDLVLGSSLVNMYAKCASLHDARSLFDKLSAKTVVAWNAMISGYAQQGEGDEAVKLYSTMKLESITPDCATYVSLLQACASVGVRALNEGKQLHFDIMKRTLREDPVIGGSLVNMYAKCGALDDARILFDELPKKNVVAWNAIIAGYAQHGMCQDALGVYSRMRQEGLTPSSVTYVCMLQACAAAAALRLGEQLHADVEDGGMQADGSVGASLVNMYAKCGSMYDAQRVFDSMSERSIEAWGALLDGYTRHGDSQLVFDLFDRMLREGVHPDAITFLSVLTACSHVGAVDKGRSYFKAMAIDYGIIASMEHYICVVDLLGRAGYLQEALQTANSIPFPPNGVVWRTLLGACQKWKNLEIAQQAFKGAVGVDEKDAASYVLMSNIYKSAHMWAEAKELQLTRMRLGASKKPGQSWWADFGGVVHTFGTGDKKHSESEGI